MRITKGLHQRAITGTSPFTELPARRAPRGAGGFTAIELIAVVVILGVLAAVALPRFFERTTFESLRFFDEAQATVRYAQKLAIAQRCTPVQVQITSTSIGLTLIAGTCLAVNTPITIPGSATSGTLQAPSGVTLSPVTSFTFDGSGKPSFSGSLTISVSASGEPTRNFVVEQETGYVHP